jgi:hybrid cluster-associated redox disulfide protein
MEAVSLTGLGILLLLSLLNLRRSSRLMREIARVEQATDELKVFVNVSHERVKTEVLTQVRSEIRKGEGGAAFRSDMSVGEAIKLHPHASAVMASFHLGGCSSCSISDNHILGDAARDYGVNLDRLLKALNGLLDGTTPPPETSAPSVPDRSGSVLQVQPAT